jgi:hypothetical protein
MVACMDKAEVRLAAAIGILLFVVRAPLLVPVYASPDDIVNRHAPNLTDAWLWRLCASQGRPVEGILALVLRWIGLSPVSASPVFGLLAIAALALSAVLLARLWQMTGVVAVLAAAVVFVHPYEIENWLFRFNPFMTAAATALCLLGILKLRDGKWAGALLAVCGAAIYQIALVECVIVALVAAALDTARGLPARRWMRALAVLVASIAAWLVVWRLALAALGIAPERRFSLSLLALGDLADRVRYLLTSAFLDEPSFAAPLFQPVLLALLLLVVAGLLVRRKPIAVALFAVAACAALATQLPLRIFWPTWRTLTPFCFFWGAIVAAVSEAWPAGAARKLAFSLAGVALAASAGISAHAFDDSVRIYQRDRETAVLLRTRFQADPGWDDLHAAALVGTPAGYSDLQTTNFDTNISTLGVSWAATTLLRETWGRPLDDPTEAERVLAHARCTRRPRWPSRDSTLSEAGVAIVCF